MLLIADKEGNIIRASQSKPTVEADQETFEFFGEYLWTVDLGYEGEDTPGALLGVDPRPQGYESHRDKMDDLLAAAVSELAWLDTTIPTISDPVTKRLAQENRKMIHAWRYVLNRLLNS